MNRTFDARPVKYRDDVDAKPDQWEIVETTGEEDKPIGEFFDAYLDAKIRAEELNDQES